MHYLHHNLVVYKVLYNELILKRPAKSRATDFWLRCTAGAAGAVQTYRMPIPYHIWSPFTTVLLDPFVLFCLGCLVTPLLVVSTVDESVAKSWVSPAAQSASQSC